MAEDSSDEDDDEKPTKIGVIHEREEHIGKIVCVENTETKKKAPKESWFPALVVSPNAQDAVRIHVKEEYLVRSFKDGRYYTVPKKEATEFTREQAVKQDSPAVQSALEYMNDDRLPAHWDREALFGLNDSSSDYNNEFPSDSSDDEPTEEKDHFVAQLYKYMDDRGTPLNKGPSIVNKDVDLYRLYRGVQKLGGYNRVTTQDQWKQIANRLGFHPTTNSIQNLVKQAYKKFLLPFEEFDRKLGCTMVAHPRANRIKGRSLLRANSVASPKPEKDVKANANASAAEESENTSESSVDNSRSKLKVPPAGGKVKTLIDKFEDRIDEIKKEPKEPKLDVPSTSRTKSAKEKAPADSAAEGKSVIKTEVTTPTSRQRDKAAARKAVTPQTADDKKNKKRAKEILDPPPVASVGDKDKDNDFPISVGDKLKVYYHEQKVTYEAKVIEISEQKDNTLYLVHYAGWNSRYDEWVQKERIAENHTTNKTNKKVKNNGKTEAKSNSNEKAPAGPSGPASKASSKRSRGSSRGDSQPPRSTTPSSIASNSSRTKSPATPAQRRTTRGVHQPILRRTSNNTDISSMQTDSDTDSDEPVVKKPAPRRKVSNTAKANKAARTSNLASSIDSKNNSNPSSEEETLANIKNREFGLSEAKGFKNSKSSSPEAEKPANEEPERKFDINKVKKEPEPLISSVPVSTIRSTADIKPPSENSSETDSLLELDEDAPLSIPFSRYQAFNRAQTSTASQPADKSDIVQRVATLKPSGIEKIIKTSLAEKSKALPEKLSMKTLCERSPVKLEKEKEREREEKERAEKQKELEQQKNASGSAPLKMIAGPSTIQAPEPSTSTTSSTSATLTHHTFDAPASTVIKTEPIEPIVKPTPKLSYLDKPILQKSNLLKSVQKDKLGSKPPLLDGGENKAQTSISAVASSCDIYEFKEPEPFEFETAKKPSPDADKKAKRKVNVLDKSPIPDTAKMTVAAKRAKKTFKEIEKIRDIKLEDDELPLLTLPAPPPSSAATATATVGPLSPTIPILVPPKIESIFDSLRKSPNFNLNLSSGAGALDEPSTSAVMKPLEAAPITVPVPHVAPRPLFINSFVEAKPIEDTSTVFDLKSKERDVREEMEKGLESVKKLLTDEELNREPPKIDKPSSIADKVLKALSSQNTLRLEKEKQDSEQAATVASTSKVSVIAPVHAAVTDTVVDRSRELKVKEKETRIASPSNIPLRSSPLPSGNASQSLTTAPSVPHKEPDVTTIKPVLSSPEHKIDILESIAPKNNDLTETIQKLESAIQKSAELALINEDSTDSTDSEQRLVIEDESQSSETQNDVVPAAVAKKDEAVPVVVAAPVPVQPVPVALPTVLSTATVAGITVPIVQAPAAVVIKTESAQSLAEAKAKADEAELKAAEQALNTLAAAAEPLKTEHDEAMAEANAQNESISMLLCEETIPGSPAPVCPKEICDNKKSYDSIFTSPHSIVASDTTKSVSSESTSSGAKAKNDAATPNSSPRDSLSQDDSSEENQKKQGKMNEFIILCKIFIRPFSHLSH